MTRSMTRPSGAYRVRKRRRIWKSGRRRLKLRSTALRRLVLLAGASVTVATLHTVAVADQAIFPRLSGGAAAAESPEFTRRFYLGAGIGATQLEPKSPTQALVASDKSDSGYRVMFGYDLSRWISAELFYSDLGEAGMDFLGAPVGTVDYQTYGVSGLFYVFNSQSGFGLGNLTSGLARREGLSLFGRAGVGGMFNDSNLEYRRDYDVHGSVGLGLEYGFRNGLAVRGEWIGFDTDAQFLGISLLKRLGDVPVAAPIPVPPVAKVVEEPAVVVAETPRKLMFKPIVPPITYFGFDNAALSAESRAKLDEFVETLADNDMDLSIEGHADWVGTERYNDALSLQRAITIKDYLLRRGIDESRIKVEGFGETQPVSTNLTEEGRAQNRRAEIRLLHSE